MASVNPTVEVGVRSGKWRSFAMFAGALMAALVVGTVIGNAISERSIEQSTATQSSGLTKAQVAEAARWTGLAEALTKADTFSPELARAEAAAVTPIEAFSPELARAEAAAPEIAFDKVDRHELAEAAKVRAEVVTPVEAFSPELARLEASLGSIPDEAASGLSIGARHIDTDFEVGTRYVGQSDMTLEEFELQGLTKAQKADAGRYAGNTYQGGFEDEPEDVHRPNIR